MKHILVFVDFSNTAILAFNQALAIAKLRGSKMSLCHIVKDLNESTKSEFENNLKPFYTKAEEKGVMLEPIILCGDLYKTAKQAVLEYKPDLIVAGTHGSEGIHLSLFGSAIHKLVREVSAPTLVISKECKIIRSGFSKILIPASVHNYYMVKVDNACKLLAEDGEVVLFAIVNSDAPLNGEAKKNIENAKKYLDQKGIKWEYVEEKAKPHQTGYAPQTLEHMRTNNVEMIAISAEVSDKFKLFGKLDKELVLLNEDGILVLCISRPAK